MSLSPQPPAEDTLDSPSSLPSSSQLPAIVCGDGTPPSLRWRRSPSYEQLQEMVFSSSPTSSLSRPNPRRSHTLSLSGSDMFRDDQRYCKLLLLGEGFICIWDTCIPFFAALPFLYITLNVNRRTKMGRGGAGLQFKANLLQ